MLSTACISDTDCGVCDPNKLVLESITAVNYENRKVNRLTPGVDQGKFFIEDIVDCLETEEALENARGESEYCKLSPLITGSGLEFVFNNLLDATSIELVRKDPSNPQLFEVYDWKNRLASIEGPISRFNGDYFELSGEDPDTVTRAVNLSCIDNLRATGQDFNHEVLDADPLICNGFYAASDGRQLPLRMQESGTTKSYAGETDWRAASCSAPDSGPDTCCTACDYELSVNVAKYGVTSDGTKRTPADAIACDPTGNVYTECADFVSDVNRDFETNRYVYDWNGESGEWRLPISDKIRETHPAQRADGVEPDGAPCQTDADCDDRLGGDSGAVCIGTNSQGDVCSAEADDCGDKHCKAEWFVTCAAQTDTTGGAYCVDRRFRDKGAGGCYIGTEEFQSCEMDGTCTTWEAGRRLAYCDTGEFPDGLLSASECCQAALGASGDGAACDPTFLPNVQPIKRFDRDQTLPEETRTCFCGDPSNQPEYCASQIERFCTAPWGDLVRHDGATNENAYVTRFVTKVGGVIYDPSLKGVLYLPGDRGNQPRSLVEACAEITTSPSDLIGGRNPQDGWRMHDDAFFENYENFDRAMCSGSEYRVTFATDGHQIRDKVGNVLNEDELTYVFETPEFHVIPGTGFPTDNLRIGACDDFQIQVSNKYDLSPENTRKLELVQLRRIAGATDEFGEDCATSTEPECWEEDLIIAGGANCTEISTDVVPDQPGADNNGDAVPPCLTVDVANQRFGEIRVVIDNVRFGTQLNAFDENNPEDNVDAYGRATTGRYRMRLPGLETVERFEDLDLGNPADLAAYNAAFHDVCGMPLVTSGGQDYKDFYYDFTIDPPKCKEDEDGDGVQLSCDNARDHFNPDQFDEDLDGFGNIVDKCQLTASDSDTADSDKDGIGNDCDRCRESAGNYNEDDLGVPAPLLVRNIPDQTDTDRDGIGDVCDNCIWTPNCSIFNEDNPHVVGTEVPYDQSSLCQTDENVNMIGDACQDPDNGDLGLQINAWASGPIGFGNDDDFDQDGLSNVEDYCPRQPIAAVEPATCGNDDDCPESTCSSTGYCNHVDTDADGVGNACDTCPFSPNPLQIVEGGAEEDDDDGDFIGQACEADSECASQRDPRPYALMEVSVNGLCCSTAYPGDGYYDGQNEDGTWRCEGLCDPDGFPIQQNCTDEADLSVHTPDGSKCRSVPAAVASRPGILELPPGCEDALANAGLCDPGDPNCDPDTANRRLRLTDIPDLEELWGKMCWLPQWDQDFDGVGDACDLCPFAYDPNNEEYIDEVTGKKWNNIGKYCAGAYSPDAICAAEDEAEGEDETGTDETGGEETTDGG
ncbi:thrombospondin type 3 repeat family protein [Plesiocystis pacifica SIR-1]|uniref:Thrombospondin type 3 repeat family protein n=1 Tax=Plesiocystis pacifica SIR-1 TaxID=391625 RepID=A6GHJ5_9BACT|nr:thrombospondin type 3 repeat family protein [Plesiocystis pacifica SIR-1]